MFKLIKHYRAYSTSDSGKLLIEGMSGPELWVLLDDSNGNPDLGYGYVWVFDSRQAARDHKRNQEMNHNNATLKGPWRTRDVSSKFFKNVHLGK